MTTNAQLDFIFGRRSIRSFKPGEISPETETLLLKAAMAAPSAVAKDPWRFVVLRDRQQMLEVTKALPNGQMLKDASLGLVICGDLSAAHDKQLSYLLQDCSAAIENILLAAHALGLGTCWLGIHPREDRIHKITTILNLPPNVLPISGIAVGYPAEHPEPRTRYNSEFVHYNRW